MRKAIVCCFFLVLLTALILGGAMQFYLARGPARRLVVKYGDQCGYRGALPTIVARPSRTAVPAPGKVPFRP